MERDDALKVLEDSEINFNSHAHVERDYLAVTLGIVAVISTHTLTWSVTHLINEHSFKEIISTHTLTWSVTAFNLSTASMSTISTHTLTWSVTKFP